MWPFFMSLGNTLMLICQKEIHYPKIEGEFMDIMCEVNLEHKKCMDVELGNGTIPMFIEIMLRMHVVSITMVLPLNKNIEITWFCYKSILKCMANSIIDKKQWKIAWYVADNKDSQVEKHFNTKIISKIAKQFSELIVSRGTNHKLLGMEIEFLEHRKVSFLMKD